MEPQSPLAVNPLNTFCVLSHDFYTATYLFSEIANTATMSFTANDSIINSYGILVMLIIWFSCTHQLLKNCPIPDSPVNMVALHATVSLTHFHIWIVACDLKPDFIPISAAQAVKGRTVNDTLNFNGSTCIYNKYMCN